MKGEDPPAVPQKVLAAQPDVDGTCVTFDLGLWMSSEALRDAVICVELVCRERLVDFLQHVVVERHLA